MNRCCFDHHGFLCRLPWKLWPGLLSSRCIGWHGKLMTSLLNCLRPSTSPSPHLPEAVLSLTQQHGMPARDEHQVRRCWICIIRHCSTRRLTSTRVIYTTRYLLRIGFHVTPAFSPGAGMRAPYMQDMHSRGGKNIPAEEKTKGFASLTRPTRCTPVPFAVNLLLSEDDSAERPL